jgi:hypothetical protein
MGQYLTRLLRLSTKYFYYYYYYYYYIQQYSVKNLNITYRNYKLYVWYWIYAKFYLSWEKCIPLLNVFGHKVHTFIERVWTQSAYVDWKCLDTKCIRILNVFGHKVHIYTKSVWTQTAYIYWKWESMMLLKWGNGRSLKWSGSELGLLMCDFRFHNTGKFHD